MYDTNAPQIIGIIAARKMSPPMLFTSMIFWLLSLQKFRKGIAI